MVEVARAGHELTEAAVALAFILKKGFPPDRVEVESNERHQHRQEKTSQHVRSRLVAYQFTIHGYSLGWENVGWSS